jgi:hypothetical protein
VGNATRVAKFAAGMALALGMAAPAAFAADATLTADDFDWSQTRTTGHFEFVSDGLHIWTEGNTSTDKVAGYVETSTPLTEVGEPALSYTTNAGAIPPSYQLVVDFDGNGTADGILVGEPTYYGNDWWASNGSAQFVKDGAPSHTGGSGSTNHGTLDQWRAAFPDATVLAFGFSLGSGVYGDYLLGSMTFAGDTYTFGVALSGEDECKNGGWATSTSPAFKNQGDCVSHFTAGK